MKLSIGEVSVCAVAAAMPFRASRIERAAWNYSCVCREPGRA
jgi:hypothetical protein